MLDFDRNPPTRSKVPYSPVTTTPMMSNSVLLIPKNVFIYCTIIGLCSIKYYTSREEKSLRLVTTVAKPLDINKPWSCKHDRENKKNVSMTFLCMIALRNKTVPHVFLPSFNNTNGCLRQERLLRSRNLAAMVT